MFIIFPLYPSLIDSLERPIFYAYVTVLHVLHINQSITGGAINVTAQRLQYRVLGHMDGSC